MKRLQRRSRDERDYELLQSDSGATGCYRVRRVYPSTLRNATLLRKNAFADDINGLSPPFPYLSVLPAGLSKTPVETS